MPVIKNALLRYRIIDRCLRNEFSPFPDKEKLRSACEEELFGSTEGDHICDSTIEKDLYAMRMEHDAPIKYSKREKGYYYTDDSFSLDEVPLTSTDIDAIKAATTILSQFKQTDLFRNFEFAIDKILDRVNISPNVQDKAIDDYVQFETVQVIGGNEYLEPILTAIKEKRKVQFYYQSFKSKDRKIRRVHPYLLKEYRNRWYLIGKSELRNQVITYGLDRVEELQTLDQTYSIDSNFNPDSFFEYSVGITTGNGKPEKIEIEANEVLAKYLTSQPLHHSQQRKEENGKIVFSYFLLPSYELKMQLLGYGDEVKILNPKGLKEEIIEISKNVLKLYSE